MFSRASWRAGVYLVWRTLPAAVAVSVAFNLAYRLLHRQTVDGRWVEYVPVLGLIAAVAAALLLIERAARAWVRHEHGRPSRRLLVGRIAWRMVFWSVAVMLLFVAGGGVLPWLSELDQLSVAQGLSALLIVRVFALALVFGPLLLWILLVGRTLRVVADRVTDDLERYPVATVAATPDLTILLIHGIGDIRAQDVLTGAASAVRRALPDAAATIVRLPSLDLGGGGPALQGLQLIAAGRVVHLVEYLWTLERPRFGAPLRALAAAVDVARALPAMALAPSTRRWRRAASSLGGYTAAGALLGGLLACAVVLVSETACRSVSLPWCPSDAGKPSAFLLVSSGILAVAYVGALCAFLLIPVFGRISLGVGVSFTVVCTVLSPLLMVQFLPRILSEEVAAQRSFWMTVVPWAIGIVILYGSIRIGLTVIALVRDISYYLAPDTAGRPRPRHETMKRALADVVRHCRAQSDGPLVLVAHSLGTVIVTDVLRELWTSIGAERGGRIDLVTAGSPLRRFIRRLLPDRADAVRDLLDAGRVTHWLNVYRLLDYVGQALRFSALGPLRLCRRRPGVDARLTEHLLSPWFKPPLGHGGYWGDDRFFHIVAGTIIQPALAAAPPRSNPRVVAPGGVSKAVPRIRYGFAPLFAIVAACLLSLALQLDSAGAFDDLWPFRAPLVRLRVAYATGLVGGGGLPADWMGFLRHEGGQRPSLERVACEDAKLPACLARGTADIVWLYPRRYADRAAFQGATVVELPLMARSSAHGTRILASLWDPHLAAGFTDYRVLALVVQPPFTLHSVASRVVARPDDIEGLKVRTVPAGDPLIVLLGGTPVSRPADKIKAAARERAIDAFAASFKTVGDIGLHEIGTQHLDVPLFTVVAAALMARARYEELDEGTRQVLDATASLEVGLGARIARAWDEEDRSVREWLVKLRHTIHAPTPEEMTSWAERSRRVRTAWRQKLEARDIPARAVLRDAETAAASLSR